VRSVIRAVVAAVALSVAAPRPAVEAQESGWIAFGAGRAGVDGQNSLNLSLHGILRPDAGTGFQARGGLESFSADSTLKALAVPIEAGISLPAGPGRVETGVGVRLFLHSQLPGSKDEDPAWFAALRYVLLLGSRAGLSVSLAAGQRVHGVVVMLEGVPTS